MIRRWTLVIIAAALAASPRPGASALMGGPRLWSQYEIARAVSSEGIRLDDAAILTSSREYGRALDALALSCDSLRLGMLACRAGRYRSAVAYLETPSRNEYLEPLRRFYRSKSLFEEKRYGEAAVEIDSLFALAAAGREAPPSIARDARHLSGLIVASSDSLFAAAGMPREQELLSERALLLFAQRFLARGEDTTAVALLAQAACSPADPSDASLFFELLEGVDPLLAGARRSDLVAIAGRALSWGRYAETEGVIERLAARNAEDYEGQFLKAAVALERGHKRAALGLYDRLASSRAPRSIRERSGARAASIEYDLGRYAKAATRYHDLAMRYPRSERSVGWLDLGARIEVRRGDYAKAASYWGDARRLDGAPRSAALTAAVCRSVLTARLGDRGKAHEILRKALEGSGGNPEPRLLYWLYRTAPTDSARSKWEGSLAGSFPRSLYAFALRSNLDSLLTEPADSASSRLAGLARSQWRMLDTLGTGQPECDSIFADPAVEAYLYLVDRGFIQDAAELGRTLEKRLAGNRAALAALCRAIRLRGRHDLPILLSRDWRGPDPDRALRLRLQYPAAFTDLVARESAAAKLPPELVLAVIREESRFDPSAVSRAGAEGLMQLLPATARWVARRFDATQGFAEDLQDPAFNIAVGCRYLDYLIERFGGSLVGGLAAYNAGEGTMSNWRERFEPARDPFEAIEMVGPAETRAYIVRVLESLVVYRSMASTRAESR